MRGEYYLAGDHQTVLGHGEWETSQGLPDLRAWVPELNTSQHNLVMNRVFFSHDSALACTDTRPLNSNTGKKL